MEEEEEEEEDVSGHREKMKKSSTHKRKTTRTEDNWKRIGTEVKESSHRTPLTEEDAKNLQDVDIDDIGAHRFEKTAGFGRHKVKKASTTAAVVEQEQNEGARSVSHGFQKKIDH